MHCDLIILFTDVALSLHVFVLLVLREVWHGLGPLVVGPFHIRLLFVEIASHLQQLLSEEATLIVVRLA